MTDQTPFQLWEPQLARQSLPNGMPLADPASQSEATLLDAHAVKGLFSGADAVVWPTHVYGAPLQTFDRHTAGGPTLFVTPSVISADTLSAYADIGAQVDLANRGISVRYVTLVEPSGTTKPADRPSPATIRASVERLRRELCLSARVVSNLIGVSTRRYYEFRAGDEPPAARLAEIRDRIGFIGGLAARDLPAATELCRRHGEAIAGLLSEGRLTDVETLFRTTSRERTAILTLEAKPHVAGPDANELLAVVEGPVFGKILGLLRYVAPTIDARTPDRAAAALWMEKNIHAVEVGDRVDDDWEFLLVMHPGAIAGLRERAEVVIRAEAFDRAMWATFVADESEQAWAGFDYKPARSPAAARAGEVAAGTTQGDWQPDFAAFGVDLSLHDRRAG